MLSVLQLPENHFYTNPYTLHIGGQGWSAMLAPVVGPWVSGNYSSPQTLLKLDGFIQEGKVNDFDDRAVYHQQISGSVTACPFGIDYSTYSDRVNHTIGIKVSSTSTVPCSAILSPGIRLVHEYLFSDPSGNEYEALCIHELSLSGLDGLAVFAYRNIGTSPFYVFRRLFSLKAGNFGAVFIVSGNLSGQTKQQVLDLRPIAVTGKFRSAVIKPVVVPINIIQLRQSLGLIDFHYGSPSDHFLPSTVPLLADDYGDLAQNCIEQLSYLDINSVAYVKELNEMRGILALKGIVNFKSPKTWAGIFLATQYGTNLTIQDTDEIIRSVQTAVIDAKASKTYETLYSSTTRQREFGGKTYKEKLCYKLIISPYPDELSALIRHLKQWDADLSLSNLWDLIPYSFVINWFVDVSSLLERISLQTLLETYKVLGVCRSRKVIITLPVRSIAPYFPGFGDITLTEYNREVRSKIDSPRWRIDATTHFNNFVELGAIIVQNLSKH